MRSSEPEIELAWQLKAAGLEFEREVTLIPDRRFRFDFWNAAAKLAVEIDGGTWVQGRHVRGTGVESDCEKQSLAAGMGIRIVRCTPKQVRAGEALEWITAALDSGGPKV